MVSAHRRRSTTRGSTTVGQFVGTYPGYFAASNYPVEQGRLVHPTDVRQGRQVVLIGDTVADDLFGTVDPVGKQITVGGTLFTVVGVLADEGRRAGFNDPNDIAIAPVQRGAAGADRVRPAQPDPGPGDRTGRRSPRRRPRSPRSSTSSCT